MRNHSDSRLPPDIKRTYPLGCIDFVAADRHEVDIEFIDIDGYLADRLGSVGMEEYFIVPADLPDFLDRLDHTYFVVDHYH